MKRTWGLFLYAVLAGFSIGIGGTVFLRLKDAFPGGNVVGALLFTIGLFTVCTRGYALFTGKSCYLFDNPWPAYLGDLAVFWVEKGSITIDGISLTVARVDSRSFAISAIPHTVSVTVLADRKPGDIVNLETDIIGKYVEKLLHFPQEEAAPAPKQSSGITKEFLTRYGY